MSDTVNGKYNFQMINKPTNTFNWNGRLPLFQRVRQQFHRPFIEDTSFTVRQAIDGLEGLPSLVSGKRIAITAGSRGIQDYPIILASLVGKLQEMGAFPFIIPAMGSHGGATAEGQRQLLADLGITETSTGAPIVASMETVEIGCLPNGMPVFTDQLAALSDGIIIVNRVKPHTDFSGEFESGLAKMTAIGLGKFNGADTIHRFGLQGLREFVPQAARLACQKLPILFGLATVENAYHEIASVSVVPPQGIAGPQEHELLEMAYRLMPRFPFPEIDVLIVDEIGKNISGVGMDPKVIGRVKVHGVSDTESCSIRIITALRLTSESHGNAAGIGLADVTTKNLFEQIDFDITYLNCITSGLTGIQRAAIPLVTPNDRSAIETAVRVCGKPDPQQARIVRIRNTLSLEEMVVSANLVPSEKLETIGEEFEFSFDNQGTIMGFES